MAITKDTMMKLDTMRLPELWALHVEVFGEATRNPNKKSLVRKLADAMALKLAAEIEAGTTAEAANPATAEPEGEHDVAQQPDDDGADDGADDAAGHADAADAEATPVRLTKLTVEELQARYREVIGRDTSSSDKAYLVWKLREAAKGRVPVGPRTTTHREGPAAEMMVLPLRMERDAVEAMDEAWKRLGLKNRMDLFRCALRAYFQGAGETDVAARL